MCNFQSPRRGRSYRFPRSAGETVRHAATTRRQGDGLAGKVWARRGPATWDQRGLEGERGGSVVLAETLVVVAVIVVVVMEVLDALRNVAVEAELALLQDEHPVAELTYGAGGMADEEDRGAVLPDLTHPLLALPLERPVPHRQRLVGDEDVGLDVDRHRKAEAGLHAGAVVGYRGVQELAEVGEIDDLVELSPGLGLAHAEDRGVEPEIVAAAELRLEAGAGRDQPGDPAAGEHRPTVGVHHAADH